MDALISVMQDTGMSDRSIANVLSLWLDLPYTPLLYRVATNMHAPGVTVEAKNCVVDKLRPHGFEAWAREP